METGGGERESGEVIHAQQKCAQSHIHESHLCVLLCTSCANFCCVNIFTLKLISKSTKCSLIKTRTATAFFLFLLFHFQPKYFY